MAGVSLLYHLALSVILQKQTFGSVYFAGPISHVQLDLPGYQPVCLAQLLTSFFRKFFANNEMRQDTVRKFANE